jgi:5'-nucleotidase
MTLEQNERLILITNDDGLYASGLKTLIEVMEEFGKVVLVSTPESQSGMSMALTVKTLYLQRHANRQHKACN